jgi:hypothetical protein
VRAQEIRAVLEYPQSGQAKARSQFESPGRTIYFHAYNFIGSASLIAAGF